MYKSLRLSGVIILALCYIMPLYATEKNQLSYNVHGSTAWVPYYIPNSQDMPGIILEIIPEILKLANIKATAKSFPPKRTQYAIDKGLLDFDIVSPSWFKYGKADENSVFSDSFLTTENYLVTLKHNHKNPEIFNTLENQNIGTVLGYIYHNDGEFIRTDFRSEKDLIRGLARGRIKVAIIGKYPAFYWSKALNVPISLASLHSSGGLVLRLKKSHKGLLPQINQAIVQLKQQGKIKTIIEKYSNTMPQLSSLSK